jgi:hypothetical protein
VACPARCRFLITAVLLAGCTRYTGQHWDEVRQSVIEPINSSVHRHLPRDIKAKNMDAVLSMYAVDSGTGLTWSEPVDVSQGFAEQRLRWTGPTGSEPMQARYEQLFATFDTIERAELRIHRVYWDDKEARGYPADVRLLVRGIGPDGSRRMLDQRSRVWIDQRDSQWVLTGEDVKWREMVSTQVPAFDVATQTSGLDDVHDIDGSPPFRLLGDMGTSSGLAVADFDCDGFEDVALLSSSRLRLYRNGADGTFTDVTAERRLPAQIDIAGTGLVFFDADNDGDPDLWVSGIRGQRFYRNDDCKSFSDVTDAAGIAPSVWASMPIVADYDRDGRLDVFVVRMGDHEHTSPLPNWDAHNGTRDSLYHNNGDGTFSAATSGLGRGATSGAGFGAAWFDYNGDNRQDLYLGNDFIGERPDHNHLWRNNGRAGGGKEFTDVSAQSDTALFNNTMGIAVGDFDRDLRLDLALSDIGAKKLLRNRGNGTFADIASSARVARPLQRSTVQSITWGVGSYDFNLDGWEDLYISNGHAIRFPTGKAKRQQLPVLMRNLGTNPQAMFTGQTGRQVIPDLNTDFIYSALAQELGLVGVSALLLVYMLFVARGFKIAMLADDGFSKLLAVGLTFAFALQTFIIVGGILRLIPLTGITLPFVSYGGSSVVANFVLLAGLLLVSNRANAERG